MRRSFERSRRRTAYLCGALALAGCNAGPDFHTPDPGLPEKSFLGKPRPAVEGGEASPSLDAKWWRQLRDPVLASLIERAASANLDVQAATTRLVGSRAQRNAAASAQFPTLGYSAQYQREQLSQNGVVSLGNALTHTPFIVPPLDVWQTGLDASWEVDLWGHVRRQVEAAEAQSEALEFERRDVLVAVTAEIARDYAELRGVEAQIAIAKANLDTAEDIRGLTRTRAQKGVTNYLDVENAAAQVESIRAELPNLVNQQSALIDAIGLLLGEPPQALRGELAARGRIPFAPPRPPVGVASDLARRRPDIRRAEAQLHAATANVGVAVAEFYPSFKINGNLSVNALDAAKLFRASSLQYQIGPTISVPIFDGGRLRSQLELRDAQAQEAFVVYHKTVLAAWTEVVDALVAFRAEQLRHARLAAQSAHQREALHLARARYDNGVADFIRVLDAERQLLQAELAEAQSATAVATDFVKLYKALGGGWEETFPVE